MVKKLCCLLLAVGMVWPVVVTAESQFSLKADKKSLAMGEPLLLELKAEEVSEPLDSINLDKLKQNFNVFAISSNVKTKSVKGRTIRSETMSLTLYPLRSGRLQLPALIYRGKTSKALTVLVSESSKHTQKVIFKTALDNESPHVRQAATLTLEIYDDGTLQWTAPREIVAAGAHLRRLDESQREEMVEGTRHTVHRYAWALMPLREGSLKVEFPLLDAFKFGTRLRYPVAPLKLLAAPVPAYLPVYVPIGRPQVLVEPLPQEVALDQPTNWTFTIQGSSISEEGVSKLLASISSNTDLHFYPLTIGKGGNERVTTAIQTLKVTIPFVPVRAGNIQLPALNIPYFNPSNLQVASVYIEGAHVDVFNPVWRTAQKVAVVLIVLIGLAGLGYWLYIQLRRYLHRRKVLLEIRRAASAGELHGALLKFTGGDRPMRNFTLQQWLQHMQQFYWVDERMDKMVRKLEAAKYADENTKVDMAELAHEAFGLMKLCKVRYSNLQ